MSSVYCTLSRQHSWYITSTLSFSPSKTTQHLVCIIVYRVYSASIDFSTCIKCAACNLMTERAGRNMRIICTCYKKLNARLKKLGNNSFPILICRLNHT